ncbi:formate dehydrogenase accessory protein FdhE [Desulfovibrio sulfodismutans]|uniref:Formate dehydrogenase accessory protein FdhE n=1 Tax=Desulfolutivibrio sulfodismutans TaxID=63561 RepID=A0A7K3NG63_9BACT|nr:formate dehydrogenase accessory protein FdhE [Desulfolutivibrio sulfodismutans]NDY55171.1 formate dehydrogenase accessory protein FdhE [Desulfolutivibrio sulfodismutans]QLA12140.1 formate dehydrogenase accessory protein FdhE [Desulfolutivibrio sulfodismutans DSM 3696]
MTSDCSSGCEASRTIRADAARLGREIVSLTPLLDAFVPLLAEQAEIQSTASGWTGDPPVFDPEVFCQGRPLLADSGFQNVAPDIPGAAARLLPVMARCFPGLAGDIDALAQALDADPGRAAAELMHMACGDCGEPLRGVAPDTAYFLARECVRPLVRRQAETLSPLFAELPWRFTTCPVCGGHPDFSWFKKVRDDAQYITGHGGPRFLRCADCAAWWRYKRISCPGCGNEEPSRLSFLHSPERPYERVDLCEECQTYVPCLDTTDMIHIPHPDVAALAMLPLEMLARDRGYRPLAALPWSLVLPDASRAA